MDEIAGLYHHHRELIGGAAIVREIVEAKADRLARQMMDWFFQSGNDAIVGLSMEGTIVLWSPGAERLLGWTTDEILGRSARELVPPGDVSGHLESLLAPASVGTASLGECQALHRQGELVDVSCSGTAIRDGEGRQLGAVVVLRDIGPLKRTQRSLTESQRLLRSLSSRQLAALEAQMSAIAAELQEDFGQRAATMKYELALLERQCEGAGSSVENRLARLGELLHSTLDGLRRLSQQMRPQMVEELGLECALEALLEQVAQREGLQTSLQCTFPLSDIGSEVQLALFRLVQDGLRCLLRCPGRKNFEVHLLALNEHLRLAFRCEAGEPLAPEKESVQFFEILAMQERAQSIGGRLEVLSAEGVNLIRLDFPLSLVVGQ